MLWRINAVWLGGAVVAWYLVHQSLAAASPSVVPAAAAVDSLCPFLSLVPPFLLLVQAYLLVQEIRTVQGQSPNQDQKYIHHHLFLRVFRHHRDILDQVLN